jgi:hypothetical protein
MCLLWGTNWVSISQKTAFFIVTAVKTSNLILQCLLTVRHANDTCVWNAATDCICTCTLLQGLWKFRMQHFQHCIMTGFDFAASNIKSDCGALSSQANYTDWATVYTNKAYLVSSRICLAVWVPGWRHRRPGFDSRRSQIFWEAVCLDRSPFSHMSINERLLEWQSSSSVLENRD